jgi:hypothetical protein
MRFWELSLAISSCFLLQQEKSPAWNTRNTRYYSTNWLPLLTELRGKNLAPFPPGRLACGKFSKEHHNLIAQPIGREKCVS